MDEPSERVSTDKIRGWWASHGRLVVLGGALVLPILFCSASKFLPFSDRVAFSSPVGILYQALQRVPALMTEIGCLVWLAWRAGWSPTQKRRLQMFVAVFVALILLPIVCQALLLVVAMYPPHQWRSAVTTAWEWVRPPNGYAMAVAQAGRALVIVFVLRIFVWTRSVALVEPEQQIRTRRPQFSVATVLMVTGIVALLIVFLPAVLRKYLWADQMEFLVRLGLHVVANGLESALIGFIVIAVAWLGWQSMDVMVPSLVVLCAMVVGLLFLTSRIRSVLPAAFGGGNTFDVIANIPFAIALVLATLAALALFRSLGLQVRFANV